MMQLGPLGEGLDQRGQALCWLGFLDGARLEWWRGVRMQGWVREAREQLAMGGRPRVLLLTTLEEGLRRVGRRWPYVRWGLGPWVEWRAERRVLGFWPERRRLVRAIGRGVVRQWYGAGCPWPGLERGEQRYWLRVGREEYSLHGLSGKGLWVMEGEEWRAEG